MNARLLLALLIVLVLTILPMPDLLTELRPPWMLLFVLYVQFFIPGCFRLPVLFLLGLCLDVLLATIIGEHAFSLLITTLLASGMARRFNFFPMGQQMALIGLFAGVYQFVILFIDAFSGYPYNILMVIGSAFISMLLWPWIRLLADDALLPRIAYDRSP